MTDVFISYSHDDSVFAERLAKDLRDAGLDVWIDFRSIPGGKEWEQAIFEGIRTADFVIVCLSPLAASSKWVQHEVLLARGQTKSLLPLIVKQKAMMEGGEQELFGLLRQNENLAKLLDIQMVDFERYGYERAFPMLLAALPGIAPAKSDGKNAVPTTPDDSTIDPTTIPNPFKGLEAFQQTDAHLFFGREALTQKLIDRLSDARADRFLAVVGASGSGKSSLVRAGLIPKIRAGALPESATWPLVIFTPGAFPIKALSLRLMPVITDRGLPPAAADMLEKGAEGLHVLTESLFAEAPQAARLVLVVDQFEEVFTRASAAEARQFLDLLISAVTQPGGRTLVVLTMRADFFDRLSAYPALAALFEQENLVIATEMQPDELRRSIEAPAQAVGLAYEHGLVDNILEAVRQQPGSLPLLQYALKELYKQRDGRWLKAAAYQDMGGVRGALAGHAESIYTSLPTAQQDVMRRLLLRLVEVSDTGEATRRRLSRDALTFRDTTPESVDHMLDLLTAPDNRLLVASRDIQSASRTPTPTLPRIQGREAFSPSLYTERGPGGEVQASSSPALYTGKGLGEGVSSATLELSHEALVREWPRLRVWIGDDAASLRYGGDLLKDAQDWAKRERDPEYVLQGERRVIQAQVWLESADASDLQRDFIEASAAESEKQVKQKEAEQAEKLRLAQRAEAAERDRAARYRRGAQIVAALLVLAVLASVFAVSSTLNAQSTLATVEFQSTVASLVQVNELNWFVAFLELPTYAATAAPADIMATATAWALPTPVPVIQEFDGVEMVQVPAGCFLMGSAYNSDEQPVNQQCFEQPFWMDRYEVTNQQFEDFHGVAADVSYFCDPDQNGTVSSDEGAACARHPREQISWLEARNFCFNRGADLPTEAQWEYAARGPTNRVYPWGNDFVVDNVVYGGNSNNQTAEVGSKPLGISWVGAFDMSGNVWEFVSTIYDHYPYPYTSVDGRESYADNYGGRVVRGGSFNVSLIDLRATNRNQGFPIGGFLDYGFRCARSSS